MRSGKHTGKLAIIMNNNDTRQSFRPQLAPRWQHRCPALFASHEQHLITGGTSGVGLALAAWMVQNGARHVALLGRGGRSALGAVGELWVHEMESQHGAEISVVSAVPASSSVAAERG